MQLGQLISEPLSRFDHACDANAYLSVEIRPGLPIRATVRSLRAIAQHEPVTLCYLPHAGNTTEIRRQRLQEAYDFKCECRLCASTTLSSGKPKIFKHRHMISIITNFTSVCIIH